MSSARLNWVTLYIYILILTEKHLLRTVTNDTRRHDGTHTNSLCRNSKKCLAFHVCIDANGRQFEHILNG
ncbi:hypothetical protein TSAR_002400 [Trichomalopsis sarcophagae]|uniref:Secreted protein n=1 Tax=Trichomalopsis sarcophagae TaxID=543379 RepID=A0A232EGW8_9HYME|nr:hypothetical protein TSAR_002400 [Trichomalopsis sarcophagae]